MTSNKLLIFDFPEGYKFGIDLHDWTVGPNFKGIKHIPDGCHYVYYGAKEDMNKTGFFIHLKSSQVIAKKWCPKEEDLLDYHCTEDDLNRFRDNESEIDRFLGKYHMESHKNWWTLSNYVTLDIVTDLTPDCGRIYSVEQFQSPESNTAQRLEMPPTMDYDTLLAVKPETKIHFLNIPKYCFPEGCDSKTKYMLDKTYTLEGILSQRQSTREDPRALMGEFQFAFITYNLGYRLAALEQWLAIIDLLSSCVEAVTKYQGLFVSFLTVLHFQMKLTDEDFADITTDNNRFFNSMKKLFDVILNEPNITDDLKTKTIGLKTVLSEKNEWDFDGELEDEQPVYVELDECNDS